MSDLSPRRRLAGRALLGAGLLILPLTASISYAASEAALAAQDVPEPPAPPAPPEAPDAPTAPEAPEAPELSEPLVTILFRSGDEKSEGEDGVVVSEQFERGVDGKQRTVKIVRRTGPIGKPFIVEFDRPKGLSKADHEAVVIALREGLAEAERVQADLPRILADAMAEADAARAALSRVVVERDCRPGSSEVSEITTDKDGKQRFTVCLARAFVSARQGLEEARDEIARDKDIPEDTRKRVLEQLDKQIARWAEKEG